MSYTSTAITTENFVSGYLGKSNSRDHFTLAVTAGQTYSIAVIGIGQDPLCAVTVSAVDENGSPVALNDQGAVPDWFDKKFTATSSGTITFELAPTDSDASGQYGLKVTKGLQNDFNTLMGAGALYIEGAWGSGGGESTTVTYGFRASPPTYEGPTYEGEEGVDLTTFSVLTAAQMDAFTAVLALWSDVSNIQFQAINPGGYTDDATILIGNYVGNIDDAYAAFAYFPEGQGNRSSESSEGDVWLNLNEIDKNDSLLPGTYTYWITMHELGHALGLNHPGPYNADGSEITYENSAKFIQDSGQYTVMSYFDGFNTGQSPGNRVGSSNPQLFDILAIQNKYGPNMRTRSGDTVYGFDSNAGPMFDFALNSAPQFSIWDGGGIDTLNVSGFSQPQTINLNPATFSNIGGQTFNISIALNVSIENAIGGSGDDFIYGNSSENRIQAGAGNDRIQGCYANDHIDGGEGIDTAIYTGASNQYGVSKSSGTVIDLVEYRDGLDTLTNIERLQLSDINVALDVGPAQNAGSAYRLYKALLDRTPDLEGLGFWIKALDNGVSLRNVASGFVDSPEFRNNFFGDGSNTAFVTALYNNVLDRAPEQSGFNFWLNGLNSGADRASVLVDFSESPENQDNTAGLIANGIKYQEWVG